MWSPQIHFSSGRSGLEIEIGSCQLTIIKSKIPLFIRCTIIFKYPQEKENAAD